MKTLGTPAKHTKLWSLPVGRAVAWTALLALAASGVGCSSDSAKGQEPQQIPAIPVKVQVAHSVSVSDTTEYVATLKSRDSAVIMPEVEGRVTAIAVRSGEHVAQGARLMQIDPSKQEATVNSEQHSKAAQEANLAYAQQQYDRISGLFAAGVVPRQDLDQAKSALDTAQAQLRSLDAQVLEQTVQLHYYSVVSPWNGIVGDIPVRVGDRVTSSTTLTTIDKPGSLEAYVYVPIERAPDLKKGMAVEIVDATGQVIARSQVSFISPQVDSSTQAVLVKAVIANANNQLRNAQFIRARMVWGSQQETVIPILSVSRVGSQYFAFVAEDQNGKTVAHQRPLRVGSMVDNNYAILEGVKPGDKVIVSGTQFLVDGAPVIPRV